MATMNSLSKREAETVPKGNRNHRERRRRGRDQRTRDVGVSALMYAAQQGDVNVVKKIIGVEAPSLFQRDRTGKTALHYSSTSCSRCAAQAADLMVMAAPDLVDGRDEDGFTPLHLAVIAGNMQLVTFLLANGADVNAVDNEKHTVIHWATVCGEAAALRAVLAAGAHVSTPDVHGGYPLHYAAQMCGGDRDSSLGLQVLQTLLSHTNIEVSVTDKDKREPLLWAASAGSARAVLALVRAGANVEAADKDGLTALHCAASRGHTDCMDTLLTLCGASVDIIDTNGCTALHYAVTLGHADATALLLAHGADPNRQDRKGRSPAHCGCAKGQFETVKLIGTHGANLWLRNARGDFPLHDAAASGRRELVKWLLEMRPSQVNARNNDGRCSLHMAAINDNADMCKILLDAGAQINPVLRTSKNVFMTPLDCALQKGYRSTAKYLQVHGGVPANRLSDPSNQQVNSALNLQIRDDVTFYGDTSSESERENASVSRSENKNLKKKTVFKQEKKKTSMSGSEKESAGVKLSKQKSVDKSTAKSDERRKTPNRIDYSNEIIINGKTEVNVSHRNEIILDKESVQTQTSAKLSEKERRPKSAKYGRLRDKSAQSSINKETMISISSQASISKKDHSTSTSEEISETTKQEKAKESDKNIDQLAEEKLVAKQFTQEQTSVMSFTSEDGDELKKEIVVEASVHALPKSLNENKNNEIENEKTSKIENNYKGDIDLKETQVSITDKVKGSKAEDVTENCITKDNISEVKKDLHGQTLEIKTVSETLEVDEKLKTKDDIQLPMDALDKEVVEECKEVTNQKVNQEINELNNKELLTEDALVTENKVEIPHTEEPEHVDLQDTQIAKENEKETGKNDEKGNVSQEKVNEEIIKFEQQDTNLFIKKEKATKGEKSEHHKSFQKKDIGDEVLSEKTKGKERKKVKEQTQTKQEIKTNDLSDLSLSDEDNFQAKTHKSFRVLNDKDIDAIDDTRRKKLRQKKDLPIDETRSRSLEIKGKDKTKRSKIPTPLFKSTLSKSDRHLNQSYKETNLDARVPSLPNIRDQRNSREPPRCDSNMSAPLLTSILSDKDRDSASDLEEGSRIKSKRFVKRRSKNRDSRSAGSDYESSNLIDSGFEPSPRSTRVPKWRNVSERGVNMTSVTQNIQTNIRRYHLERKIFQQLLELKRHQIRAGQHNEAVLVKRAIDAYHKSCASTVGVGRYVAEDYTFKSFEQFLYEALRKLQKNGAEYMKGLPETPTNPLFCTKSTNRCMHAAHAYTGVPCAAYLPKMDHHMIPKIGFNNSVECKPGTGGFLPTINPKKAVTLELTHGNDKQVISLPTDKLDQNKRYYVTFTVKGHEAASDVDSLNNNTNELAHRHSKSD